MMRASDTEALRPFTAPTESDAPKTLAFTQDHRQKTAPVVKRAYGPRLSIVMTRIANEPPSFDVAKTRLPVVGEGVGIDIEADRVGARLWSGKGIPPVGRPPLVYRAPQAPPQVRPADSRQRTQAQAARDPDSMEIGRQQACCWCDHERPAVVAAPSPCQRPCCIGHNAAAHPRPPPPRHNLSTVTSPQWPSPAAAAIHPTTRAAAAPCHGLCASAALCDDRPALVLCATPTSHNDDGHSPLREAPPVSESSQGETSRRL